MKRISAWLQAGLLALVVLMVGAVGALALNGRLLPSRSQSVWKLTVLHTNDVFGYVDTCE